MEQLCTGCLCAGRKLYFIGETGFSELYTQILNEIPVSGMSSVHVRVCWECVARLRRFHLFKIQVKQCYTEMLWHIPPPPLPPRLSTHPQPPISYPEHYVMKHEVDVKSEDEHWEPETFVHDLSVVDEEGRGDREETEKGEERGEEEERGEKQERREEEKKITKKSKKKTKTKEKKEKIKKTKTKSKTKLKTKKTKQPVESNETESLVEEIRVEENGIEEKRIEAEEGRVLEVKVSIEKVEENEESVPRGSVLPDKPQCVECGKMFSSRKTYRYHLNVLHRGQNRYPCPRCGKVYQWKSNLGRHLRTHKAVDLGELHCALCDKTFASVATYRQHLRISRRHVTENDYSFTCDECGKKFVSKTRLRDHIDWEHLNNIKFRCHLCNKAYKCHTSLYVHLQNVHRNKEKKDNLCHVCGKSYQNPAKLKYHITALHTGETPYQCVQCSAAFGWYSSLYRHVREVHYKMKVQPKKSKKLKKIENEPPTYLHYQT